MKPKKDLKNILEELDSLKTQLSEDFIFNDENDMDVEPQEVVDEPNAQENDIASRAHEILQREPIIGKIRETAIDGLRKYANHPTSPLYAFFKKVFNEADKVLVDGGGK